MDAKPDNGAPARPAFADGGIGDILLESGDARGALDSFRTSLQIISNYPSPTPPRDRASQLVGPLNKMGLAHEKLAGDATRTSAERIDLWR